MARKQKKKFYVVWVGRTTGVFLTWDEVLESTFKYAGCKYKSFKTMEEADEAFENYEDDVVIKKESEPVNPNIIFDSISVDGAYSHKTGLCEYKGVNTKTKEVLFKSRVYEDGTINLVEFMAVVHALSYCKKKGLTIPIYTDSITAIAWVRRQRLNTNLKPSKKNKKIIFDSDYSINWLKNNEYNNKILKWDTVKWGENPADFDRK